MQPCSSVESVPHAVLSIGVCYRTMGERPPQYIEGIKGAYPRSRVVMWFRPKRWYLSSSGQRTTETSQQRGYARSHSVSQRLVLARVEKKEKSEEGLLQKHLHIFGRSEPTRYSHTVREHTCVNVLKGRTTVPFWLTGYPISGPSVPFSPTLPTLELG